MPIKRFSIEMQQKWDEFVLSQSVNGNFLQTRRFLSYHPEDRFVDASLVYCDPKGNLRAAIPAAALSTSQGKEFISHPGSTYGGLVLDEKSCSAKRLQGIIDDLLEYLQAEGYRKLLLKMPPDFMWRKKEAPLVEYMFLHNGFSEYTELTTYIDFAGYKEKTLANFSQGKRTNVNNGIKKGLVFRPFDSKEEIECFYGLLCDNLKKYDASPVHSLEELQRLHVAVLDGENEFIGVFDGDDMIAAGWLFLFKNCNVAHTQYLCADAKFAKLSPMTFLYYSVIEYCRDKDYQYLSWGISTEDSGKILNWGLTESKEHFGSLHGEHRAFSKDFR